MENREKLYFNWAGKKPFMRNSHQLHYILCSLYKGDIFVKGVENMVGRVLQIDTFSQLRKAHSLIWKSNGKVQFVFPRHICSEIFRTDCQCHFLQYGAVDPRRSVAGDICRDTDIRLKFSHISESLYTKTPLAIMTRIEVNRVRYFRWFSSKTRQAKNFENALSVSEV